ncbi:hypothetical protein KAI46_05160, partial [bacterium]|nr:hypothetical protein [bacterium]
AGKEIVARNAITHGIFAKDLVISAGDGRENEMEYHELMTELKNDLAPVGRMEMLMVEKIAVNYWRLRRLVRYETGEIRTRLDDFRESALHSYYGGSYNSRQRLDMEFYSYSDDISDNKFQEQLYSVAAMNSSNFNLAENKESLKYVLYHRLDREGIELSDKDYKEVKIYITELSPQLRGKLRKEILEEAEQILAEMDEVRTWKIKFDRIHKSKSLPTGRDLNNVIKYENSLERSIFRNLGALKTLQEKRIVIDTNEDLQEVTTITSS